MYSTNFAINIKSTNLFSKGLFCRHKNIKKYKTPYHIHTFICIEIEIKIEIEMEITLYMSLLHHNK